MYYKIEPERERYIMENIWDKYAKVLVDYSTNVQKGELVVISTSSIKAKDLVRAIYKRVLQKGANPVLRTGFGDMAEIYMKYASDEQLDYVDPMTRLEYEKADVFISLGAPLNTKAMAKADLGKMSRRGKATKPLSELMLSRAAKGELKWVIADVPTHALAQEANMSLDEYTDFLFKSCYLDLEDPVAKLKELDVEQTRWAQYLNGVKELRIVGDKTDITFNVEGRKWISCSGLNNYPDGEVFTSPVEDGVNGEIFFDFPQNYRGNSAKDVHLWIEKGQVVRAEASSGQEFLEAMLNMDEGSHGIGEIAFGTNFEVQDVTGNILFDEKIGGAIHMAVGASYPETGGKNISGLHWDMIKNMKNGGKAYADGKLIYENGRFVI